MSRMIRAVALAALAAGAAWPAAGCQSLAGIEDRHYVAATNRADSGDPTGSPECASYCHTLMATCTDTFAVYPSEEVCRKVCARLPPGDPAKPEGNTVACRAHQAQLAKGSGEFDQYCPAAGPGGAGVCGADCESYCTLYAELCPEDASPDCERKCGALLDDGTFDAKKNHDGDTLQCRLVHTSNATLDPTTHCAHASLAPRAGSPCAIPTPNCDDYCRVVMFSCTGDAAVYEDAAQCQAVCATFDVGVSKDSTEDTLGCRTYHAYNSLDFGVSHCPHAGPGGDGHCGTGNCAPYCRLLAAACAPEFAAAFSSAADCEANCAGIAGAKKDSYGSLAIAKNGADTLSCRMLHAARGFENADECRAAVQGDPCN